MDDARHQKPCDAQNHATHKKQHFHARSHTQRRNMAFCADLVKIFLMTQHFCPTHQCGLKHMLHCKAKKAKHTRKHKTETNTHTDTSTTTGNVLVSGVGRRRADLTTSSGLDYTIALPWLPERGRGPNLNQDQNQKA